MKRSFQTVDVFTDRKFGGNPLAVVTDAEGLTTEQMQAIAAEFNLAETTFVLPPKDSAHTAHVRIFTPKAELPFAGHPNVGTAFVLARMGRASGDALVFEEKAGLVPMDLRREDGVVTAARLAAPQPLRIGEEIDIDFIAEACMVQASDIRIDGHRPCIASCGTPLVFVELASRAALKAAAPQAAAFARGLTIDRAIGIHLYVQAREEDRDIQCRMFAPLMGIAEDPATGGANIVLGGLLAHLDRRADLTLSKRIGQGFDMGRPSILDAAAEKKAGVVTATYIGGRCVPMLSGTIEI
ncbi:PhzF family phenazine biosynthesis protein [Reyranella sp.]|uniref:PhzF family phenazine biosynthesis protein n=1 Tax=Reyranella sp. TaxID=1929291 RepID=UPI003D0B0542